MMLTSQGKKAVASGTLTIQGGEVEALLLARPRLITKATPPLPKPCNQKGGPAIEFLIVVILIAIVVSIFFFFVPNLINAESREFCENQGMKYENEWYNKAHCSGIENDYLIHKRFEKVENKWYEVKE